VHSPAPQTNGNESLVVDALKGLGGSGTMSDIREWMISNFPEQWAAGYKLHRVLTNFPDLFIVENLQNGMKLYRLTKPKANGNHSTSNGKTTHLNLNDPALLKTEKEVSQLLVDFTQ